MTRNEAHELGRKNYWIDNHEWCDCDILINTIYDHFEPQLKAKDEQIADLEAVIDKQAERIRYVESQLRLHYEE